MPRVYVSIGSNTEREKNIRGALRALKTGFANVATSPVYETQAEGFDGDDFYNLVAAFDTAEPIERVRERLTEIEAAHGRARVGPRYAPRTLDIDILLYGDLVRHDDRFDVPRREILLHAYVLGPLAELAPGLAHPETGERFADLWRRFNGKNTLREASRELEED